MKDRAIVKFLTSKPWAITKDGLETIQEIVANHMAGMNVAIPASDRATAVGSLNNPSVAIIPMVGTVAKRLYGMEAISGDAKTIYDWQQAIQSAVDNPDIEGIVLAIDSPGGTVDGTMELADYVYSVRGTKPIIAYADGQMCSAAYWIGSAADSIVAYNTAQVGSIGVILSHRDFSKMEEDAGIKTTHIYAGKYKAMGSPHAPLDEASREYLQDSVDYYYTMFVTAVAKHRGTSVEAVLANMAEGRVFIGEQAAAIGLVDVIGGLQTAINLARGGNTVNIQDAVQKFGATALLDELVTSCKDALPQGVVSAYEESKKPAPAALPPEIQEQLASMQEQLAKLAAEKVATEEALIKEREEHAIAEKKREVVATLEGVKMSDDETLVEFGMTADPTLFAHVVDVIGKSKEAVKVVAAELFAVTPGANSKETDDHQPATLTDACAYIARRDNIDIEEAIEKAKTEYPQLVQDYKTKGGN